MKPSTVIGTIRETIKSLKTMKKSQGPYVTLARGQFVSIVQCHSPSDYQTKKLVREVARLRPYTHALNTGSADDLIAALELIREDLMTSRKRFFD